MNKLVRNANMTYVSISTERNALLSRYIIYSEADLVDVKHDTLLISALLVLLAQSCAHVWGDLVEWLSIFERAVLRRDTRDTSSLLTTDCLWINCLSIEWQCAKCWLQGLSWATACTYNNYAWVARGFQEIVPSFDTNSSSWNQHNDGNKTEIYQLVNVCNS